MALEAVDLLLGGIVLPDQDLASARAGVKVSIVKVDQHVGDGVFSTSQILQTEDELTGL